MRTAAKGLALFCACALVLPDSARSTETRNPRGQGAWVPSVILIGDVNPPEPGMAMVRAIPGTDKLLASVRQVGTFVSDNGGVTWQPLGERKVVHLTFGIVFDPEKPNTFWLSGAYGPAVYKTTDGGQTYNALGTISHVDGVAVDFSDPYRRTLVVAYHEKGRELAISFSGGLRWQEIGSKLPSGAYHNSYVAIPEENAILLGCQDRIIRSADNGETWTTVSTSGATWEPRTLADGSIAWAGHTGGLQISRDKGKTWTRFSTSKIRSMVELPDKSLVILTGRQLQISRDGGNRWVNLGPPLSMEMDGVTYAPTQKTFLTWKLAKSKTPLVYRWKSQ